MPELVLAPGASWAPLKDGLIVSVGSWYAVARGPVADTLRCQLPGPAYLPGAASSPLARQLIEAGALVTVPDAVPGEQGRDRPGNLAEQIAAELGAEWAAAVARSGLSVAVVNDDAAEVNRRQIRDGRPWLLVEGRAVTPVTIGPLFVPGQTGCLECWWTRCASLTSRPREYRSLLAGRRAVPAGAGQQRAIAGAAAAVVRRWLSGPAAAVAGAAYELAGAACDGAGAAPDAGGPSLRRHPFLPVPGCPVCAGTGRPERSRPGLLMISTRAGPVVRLTRARSSGSEWAAAARGVTVDTAHGTTRVTAGDGRGRSAAQATRRALHEFAERMAMSEPPAGRAGPGGPDGCPLAGQMIAVQELASGERTWAPAADYYLHPRTCLPGPALRPTTNGAAAGAGFWAAAERGLLELLERDALILTWRWGLPRSRWVAPWPQQPGVTATYTDLSQVHGVPTIACIVSGTNQGRTVRAVGSAAARTAGAAARHALSEARSVYQWLAEAAPDAGPIKEFTDHARYYLRPERRDVLLRLQPDSGPAAGQPGEVPGPGGSREFVRSLAHRLAERGIHVYAADLTTPWMRAVGLRVVVVRSAQLYPLELGTGSAAVAERLRWRVGLAGPPFLEPLPLA